MDLGIIVSLCGAVVSLAAMSYTLVLYNRMKSKESKPQPLKTVFTPGEDVLVRLSPTMDAWVKGVYCGFESSDSNFFKLPVTYMKVMIDGKRWSILPEDVKHPPIVIKGVSE